MSIEDHPPDPSSNGHLLWATKGQPLIKQIQSMFNRDYDRF